MVLKKILSGIRHTIMCLILFFVAACNNTRDANEPIALIWKDSVATGIVVVEKLLGQVQADSLKQALTIHVMTPVAGPPMLATTS